MLVTLPNLQIDEVDLVADVCRSSFTDFLKEFWSVVVPEPLVLNWHVEFLCQQLQEVAERLFRVEPFVKDLVINVPPGSTKSTICSQMFPAWVWTRMPSARFICVASTHLLALRDSVRMRDIVCSDLYRRCYKLSLREDENTKGLFVNSKGGARLSIGVGGTVTGFHGHFLIVDDPIHPEAALSKAELENVSRWFQVTLPSRRLDKRVSPIILIQQRLHEEDPSGRMLASGAARHICLPGELVEGIKVSPPECVSFYQDGLLDPIRLPRSVLDRLKQEMGQFGYASQILQSPIPLQGGIFDVSKIRIEREAPSDFVRVIRAWDKAATSEDGAYTAGVKMGVDSNKRYWVLDVVRGQWDPARRESIIRATAEADGKDVVIWVEVEGGSGGKESGMITASNLAGFRVCLFRPTGDKVARAYPLASQIGAGNVAVLDRPWTKAFLEELRLFPNSKYKDQVDAASMAFSRLAQPQRIIGSWK